MSALKHLRNWLSDHKGATALEFAILSPVFLLIVVGGINLALLLFAAGSLHYATEEAARCASVKTTCGSSAAIQSYAASNYFGPPISPTFTSSTASCGKVVTGSATFVWHVGIRQYSTPLSATACFP